MGFPLYILKRSLSMSNLEHLIENGLVRLEKATSRDEWVKAMIDDPNWQGNNNITLDNLWEICQYVIYTYCACCDKT